MQIYKEDDVDLKECIGIGRCSQVFLGVLKPAGCQLVAAKRLTNDDGDDGTVKSRMCNEIRILSFLQDRPSMDVAVRMHGIVGTLDNPVMMFTDYGISLDRLGQPKSRLEFQQRVRQVARMLQTIHELGVVHMDLKPENIIQFGTGLKLIDFGMSRLLHETTPDGGSLFYLPPERILGNKTVHPGNDIWQFGCIIAEWLDQYELSPFEGIALETNQSRIQTLQTISQKKSLDEMMSLLKETIIVEEDPIHTWKVEMKKTMIENIFPNCFQFETEHRTSAKQLFYKLS